MAFWGLPTKNTLDRATAMLPALMYKRLDEIGIDYALLYPTYGLTVTGVPDDELRQAMARAFNIYYAEAYRDFRDRLEPVAAIPTFTPEEAVAELDHAVGTLGLKTVMMAGVIPRFIPGLEGNRAARWIDSIGHDSPYDYDPMWAKCIELGVTPTFHAGGQGWGTRASTKNYVFNHLGNFAAAGEASCRGIFMGGVPMRFPELRFAFLEGGVAWACQLYADILGHFEKRNKNAIHNYDPALLDRPLLDDLFAEFARGRVAESRERIGEGLHMLSDPDEDPTVIDEFAESRISDPRRRRAHLHRPVQLRLRSRRPDECARVQPRTQSSWHAPQRDLRLRHRPLGRTRHATSTARGVGARRRRPSRRGRLPRVHLRQRGAHVDCRATPASSRAQCSKRRPSDQCRARGRLSRWSRSARR